MRQRFNAYGDERVKRGEPEWPATDVENNLFAIMDDSNDGFVSYEDFSVFYANCSAAALGGAGPKCTPRRASGRRSAGTAPDGSAARAEAVS